MLRLDAEHAAVRGQLLDLGRVLVGAIDVVAVIVDLLGRRILRVENGDFDVEGSCSLAQHPAKLAATQKANDGLWAHLDVDSCVSGRLEGMIGEWIRFEVQRGQ